LLQRLFSGIASVAHTPAGPLSPVVAAAEGLLRICADGLWCKARMSRLRAAATVRMCSFLFTTFCNKSINV
jgi:hypothetical protein